MEGLAGGIILTIFAYLLVPLIFIKKSLDSGKKYPKKKIKRIVIINCVIVWFIFRIITFLGYGSGSGSAVILWGYVGYWLMKKICLEEETEEISTEDVDNSCEK